MKLNEIAKKSSLKEGAISNKVVPAIGLVDAGVRAHEGDWTGAGIAAAATGLGLIPTVPSQAGSIGLEALNQLRDYAKEKGGWKALGKEWYDSIKNQEYDPTFLPEDFEELDRLDEAGVLDEAGGLRGWLASKGLSAIGDWFKNVRKTKPKTPPTKVEPTMEPPAAPAPAKEPKGPLDLEKEFAKREAERLAAAEKAAAEKAAAEQEAAAKYPKYDPKKHGTPEEYVQGLNKEQKAALKLDRELAAGIPVKPGWVRRAGKWVANNPKKTAAALGTGYYFTPSDITDPVVDTITGLTGKVYDVGIGAAEKVIDTGLKKNQGQVPFPKPEETPTTPTTVTPDTGETPLERERREKGWPQSKLSAPTTVSEQSLYERYTQFLKEAEAPSYTTDQYIGWAKKYADQYQVPLSLVLHAMFKESGWLGDPEKMRIARSPTGARGVMQIQPQWAEKGAYKIKVKDLTDPEKNIEAGVRGLAHYYNKYKTPEKALAAYNAGEGGASSFLKTGDVNTLRTRETKNYIKGFKDDVVHQLEKFYPKDKQKVAQIATNILATAVGAGKAQAADEVPAAKPTTDNKIAPWYKEWKTQNARLKKQGKPEIPLVLDNNGELVPQYLVNKPDTAKADASPKADTKKQADLDSAGRKIGAGYAAAATATDKLSKTDTPKTDTTKTDVEPKSRQSISGKVERPVKDVYPDEVERGVKPKAGSTPVTPVSPTATKVDKKKPAASVIPAVAEPKADGAAADTSKEKINVRKEFEKAFAKARADQVAATGSGAGGVFNWKNPVTGKESSYTTDYGDEVTPSKQKKSIQPPVSDVYPDEFTRGVKPKNNKMSNWMQQDLEKMQGDLSDNEDEIEKIIKAKQAEKPVTVEPVTTNKLANVLRSTDGTPVTSGTGEPWGTGTSTTQDIARTKAELQQQIDAEKAKKDLAKISPDLTPKEPSFVDQWNKGIDVLTGHRRQPDDRDKIRVPESVNNELQDILWLAGRTKK